MKKFISLCFTFLVFTPIIAQISENYYSDIEQKEGGKVYNHIKYNNSIIIIGKSFDKSKHHPVLIRLDTLGNTIWNTANNDTSGYSNNIYNGEYKFILSGQYIYAFILNELWKVDVLNGNILWKKYFYAYSLNVAHVIDYDSTKILVGYRLSPEARYAFINKNTGDTISTHKIGGSNAYKYSLAIDNNKDIFYSYKDTIYKASGIKTDSIIWKKTHPSTNVYDFQNMYIDQNDSVFLFGKKNSTWQVAKVICINNTTGNLIWDANPFTNAGIIKDVEYQAKVDKNGKLYIIWKHILVGSGGFDFWTSKIDKISGTINWMSAYSFTGVGSPSSHSGNGEGAISLDLDNNNDVFLTGYYGDANYGPENWGILKLNGANGIAIYEKTITEDSIRYNNNSIGLVSCVINNKPYFIGQLETGFLNNSGRFKSTFIKLEPITGNVLIKKYIEGLFQFPSKTLYIKNAPPSQTLVLKQVGRMLELEMYNFAGSLQWKKIFTKNYFLVGGDLSINSNGDIFLLAQSQSESITLPYYGPYSDSIYVFHLNSSGVLIKEYRFYVNSFSASAVEIHSDNLSTLLFYQKNNILYYRKISSSSLSNEYNSNISYTNVISNTNYCFNKSTSKAFLFGKTSGTTKFLELNKTTMAITSQTNIPIALSNINYIMNVDTNKVIICAKNNFLIESIGLYNTSTKDTVWTKKLSNSVNSNVLKCVVDPSKNYLYSISHSSSHIVIRKLASSNGQQHWEYTFNGASNLDDYPIDISYDTFRNQLLISGYETNNGNKRALFIVMDTAGIALDTILKTGDFIGDNLGLCTHTLYDGSQWVGGNLNKIPFGLAGFIFKIAGNIITSNNKLNQQDNCLINIFPNPYSNSATIEVCSSIKHEKKTFILYNIYGEQIKQFSTHDSYLTISREGLAAGTYLYQITANNGMASYGKIIIMD